MKTILFQGDSITDSSRVRDCEPYDGMGYPRFVKGELGVEYPNEYNCLNRGVSGDRIVDVYARMKADILNLKPDVMSILIGVNDVWHELEVANGVATDRFFKVYSMLIEDVKAELPNIKIMIMEPFALKGEGNERYWDEFKKDVAEKAEAAKKVAEKYGLTFIPLQKMFDDATKLAPADAWLVDGVHPTAAGHELIKREWLKAFKTL